MTTAPNMPNQAVNLDQVRAYIRSLMAEKGITTAKLAEITGVAKGTLDNFFDGTTKAPTFDKVVSIITALGGSVDEAVGIKTQVKPVPAPTDLTHILASHQQTLDAKNEFITALQDALKTERKKIKRLMLYQRLLIIENILIAFIFVLDYHNHTWGYFRGSSLLELLFPRDGSHLTIYRG